MGKCESLTRNLENDIGQLKGEVVILEQLESLFFKLLVYELQRLNKGFEDGEFFVVNRFGTSLLDSSAKYMNSFLIKFKPKKKLFKSAVGVDENFNLVERALSRQVVLVNLSRKTSEIYDLPNQSEDFKTKMVLLRDLLINLSLYAPPDDK